MEIKKENRVFYLFKRGQKEHIQALYEEGSIYINTIDYIRTCDNNPERSDPNDGIEKRWFMGDGKVSMCDIDKDINKDGITFGAINMEINRDSKEKGNIYCLTGVYSENLLGERNNIVFDTKSFGESVIFIYNPKEFINRLFCALDKKGYIKHINEKVIYYDNTYSGKIGFFKKHEKFKTQNAYRIFIPNKDNTPIKLKIGSLKDIAKITYGELCLKLIHSDGKEQLITI